MMILALALFHWVKVKDSNAVHQRFVTCLISLLTLQPTAIIPMWRSALMAGLRHLLKKNKLRDLSKPARTAPND